MSRDSRPDSKSDTARDFTPDAGEARVIDAYRAAAADEAPSEQTRAAILAAATRAVHARPRPVGATAPRRRWPLAAAASVLVGSFALLLATQVERRQGDPVEAVVSTPVAPPPAGPAADAPVPAAASTRARQRAADAPAPAVAVAGGAAGGAAAAASAAAAPPVSKPMAAPPSSAVAAERRAEAPPAATAESTPTDAAALRADRAAAARPAERALASPPSPPSPSAAQRAAPAREEPPRIAQPPARDERTRAPPAPTLDAWIERIAALRRAGRDDEADAELKALRAAHPAAELPASVQPTAR